MFSREKPIYMHRWWHSCYLRLLRRVLCDKILVFFTTMKSFYFLHVAVVYTLHVRTAGVVINERWNNEVSEATELQLTQHFNQKLLRSPFWHQEFTNIFGKSQQIINFELNRELYFKCDMQTLENQRIGFIQGTI